jgi:ABC-type transporter Mla maintaining outer membrane lipid asymmetry ATPase subunit MlaF
VKYAKLILAFVIYIANLSINLKDAIAVAVIKIAHAMQSLENATHKFAIIKTLLIIAQT